MAEWSDVGKGSKWGVMRIEAQFGQFTLVVSRVVPWEETERWQVEGQPYGVLPTQQLASSDLKLAKVQAIALLQVVLEDGLSAILAGATKGEVNENSE